MRQPYVFVNGNSFTPTKAFFPSPTATSSQAPMQIYWGGIPTRSSTPLSPNESNSPSPSSSSPSSAFSLSPEAPAFSPMYLSTAVASSHMMTSDRLSVQAFGVFHNNNNNINNNNLALKNDKKKKKKKKSAANQDKVVPPPPFAVREDLSTDSYMDSHIVSNSSDPENKFDFVLLRGVKNARSGMKAAPPCTIACKYGRNCFRKDCRFSHDPSLFVNGIYIGPPVPAASAASSSSSSPCFSSVSDGSLKGKDAEFDYQLDHEAFPEEDDQDILVMSQQSWAA